MHFAQTRSNDFARFTRIQTAANIPDQTPKKEGKKKPRKAKNLAGV